QKRGGCESGCLSEQSDSVTQLPTKLIEQLNAKCLAAVPFDIGKAAELSVCEAGRFFWSHAGAHELLGVLLDVKAQFLGHTLFKFAPPGEHSQQGTPALEHVTPPPTSYSRPRRWQLPAG